ncbi:MAG TPA: GNAT family N-acetyltransferase [Gaiellales bacterium]|nr:GNAT family N-acetyltransferase [Gaiellales bacterium]
MIRIPVLETERLVMREWRRSDFEAYAASNADAEVQRFLGGTQDREQSWRTLALQIGHWELRGYGQWALERREDRRMIGRAGLWNPEGWFGVEVGWKLDRDVWGHGYATEAAAASLEWAWRELDVDRVLAVIAPENDASLRVAARLGMRKLRDDAHSGRPVVIMAIDRPPLQTCNRRAIRPQST